MNNKMAGQMKAGTLVTPITILKCPPQHLGLAHEGHANHFLPDLLRNMQATTIKDQDQVVTVFMCLQEGNKIILGQPIKQCFFQRRLLLGNKYSSTYILLPGKSYSNKYTEETTAQ